MPVIGPAEPNAAPQLLRLMHQFGTRHIDRGAVKELVIEVGDPVEVRAAGLAFCILPALLMIEGKPKPSVETVAIRQRYPLATGASEAVEVDRRIDQLGLRRECPALVQLDALATFQAQRIAEAVIAVGKAAQKVRV